MTLRKLFELYNAEQNGKQIMKRVVKYSYSDRNLEYVVPINIGNCDLLDLISDGDDDSDTEFYIKDE